jgi:hypothetical protein
MNYLLLALLETCIASTDSLWQKKYDSLRSSEGRYIAYQFYTDSKLPFTTKNDVNFRLQKAYLLTNSGIKLNKVELTNIGDFSEGLAPVIVGGGRFSSSWFEDGSQGFINLRGTLVVPAIYPLVSEFREGKAGVLLKNIDKFMFINTEGSPAFGNKTYDRIISPFQNGVARVISNGVDTFINKDGENANTAYDQVFEQIGKVRPVKKHNKILFLYSDGMLSTNEFDGYMKGTTFCAGELIGVKKNNSYGLVSSFNAEIVVDCAYEKLKYLNKKLIWARKKGKWGIINCKGKQVTSFMYDSVQSSVSWSPIVVGVNYKYGLLDTTSKCILRPVYAYISNFSDSMAVISLNGKYGYVNMNGEIAIPIKYIGASYFKNGAATVKSYLLKMTINKQGNIQKLSLTNNGWILIVIFSAAALIIYFFRHRLKVYDI